MSNYAGKVKDFCSEKASGFCRILTPVVAFICLLTGSFLTYDFEEFKQVHPNWLEPISIIEGVLPFVFFVSASISLLLGMLHALLQPSIFNLKKKLKDLRRENEVIAETIKNVFDGYLFQLSRHLSFGANGNNCERVTIY